MNSQLARLSYQQVLWFTNYGTHPPECSTDCPVHHKTPEKTLKLFELNLV